MACPRILFKRISPNAACVGGAQGPKSPGALGPRGQGSQGPLGPGSPGAQGPRGPGTQRPNGMLQSEHSSARQISMMETLMFSADKKLRSLRSLRVHWPSIANKARFARSVEMCFAADNKLRSLRSLRQSFFVLQIFSPAGTVHFLLHIYMDHACCICNMR